MSNLTRLQERGIKLGINFEDILDTIKLINVLIIKYRLRCNLQIEKDKYSVYIYRSSLNTLFVNVKPFMLPCMYYKII